MTTALITHADCAQHLTPFGHPERAARFETLARLLESPDFDDLARFEAPVSDLDSVAMLHPRSYVDHVLSQAPKRGFVSLDPDTHMSPGSAKAALRAVGANLMAVDLVMEGRVKNAFCAVRPPGHHAEYARAMGFCLFGSVALAATHALRNHGLSRVAIVDFDVHHGNGTSNLLWEERRAMFASTHQMPLYPGTGYPSELGAYGQIINVPLDPGDGSKKFRRAFEMNILPRMDAHRPELILVSAGFDAHRRDPLANINLESEDFAWITGAICDIADTHADGRVVSTLEGGYDLRALEESVAAHLQVFMERG